MTVYRLHRHIRQPHEYNLNAEYRWNPARTPMLYSAAALSLCCLEVLVHTDVDLIPENMVWSWAELPVDPGPMEYVRDISNIEQTRALGKRWIEERRSLSIQVPSIIVPLTRIDFNILLNPLHDDYGNLQWQRGGRFVFDPRLFRDEPLV